MTATRSEMEKGKLAQLIAEHTRRMRLADNRVGRTPDSRLQWVLDFVKKDLSRMPPEERSALGDDLRALDYADRWHAAYPAGLTMPDRLLKTIHRDLKAGLRALFSERPDNEWRCPPPKTIAIHRMNPLKSKRTRFQQYYTGDEKAAIIGSVVALLLQCQERVRACERCKQPFVREKKQKFCTEECSQAERNYRKKVTRSLT
jgi:hypothetical protein